MVGQTFQYTATARYGITFADVTSIVTWISDDPSVSISSTGLATAIALGSSRINAVLGLVPSPAYQVDVEALSGITVTSPVGTTSIGLTEQFTATATFTPSGAIADVTPWANWSEDNSLIATVDAAGVATGIASGSVTITATDPNSAVNGSAPLLVDPMLSIVVTPDGVQLIPGLTRQYLATATLTPSGAVVDATQGVDWSSSQPSIVSISPATGLATGLGEQLGVFITATDPNAPAVNGSATVDAEDLNSITVTVNPPGPAEVLVAGTLQLLATGNWNLSGPLDITTQANWTSSNPAVATVNATGLVSGAAPGLVTISALGPAGSGISGSIAVQVSTATFLGWVALPDNQSIIAGATLQYALMESYSDGSFLPSANPVTGWSTDSGAIATIDASGLLTSVGAGTTNVNIFFLDDNSLAASVSTPITVTPADVTAPTVITVDPVDIATEVPLAALVSATFSEPIDPATLTNATFTLFDGVGLVPGTVSYQSGTLTATFTSSALLLENTLYTATLSTGVTDVAGNPLVAPVVWSFTTVVDGTPPVIVSRVPVVNATSVGLGSTISVTFSEPINPGTLNLASFTVNNGTFDIAGTISYDGGTNTGTFTPTTPLVGNTLYQVTVFASVTDAAPTPNAMGADASWLFATAPLPIAITVSGDVTVVEGLNTSAFQVDSVTYSDGSSSPIPTVNWSVTNGTGSATINASTGVVTAGTPGTVTVTATEPGTGVNDSVVLTVLGKTLTGLTVSGSASVVEGLNSTYSVTAATYDNGTTTPLPPVTWSVTNGTGSATINSTTGDLAAISVGTVTVTATHGATGVTGTLVVNVTPKSMTSLTISGAASVVEGLSTAAFTVTGVTYDNGDTAPLPSVTWSITAGTGTATVNSSTGVVTGGTPGTVTVVATPVGGGTNGTAPLTVLAKTVTSLTIAGDANVFLFANTNPYTVTAVTYDNGDTAPIPVVTWSVLDVTGSASMNATTGVAKGLSPGTVTVTATEPVSGVVSNGLTLTVLDKIVTSLTISGDATVVEGLTTSAYAVTAVLYDNSDTSPIPTVVWSVVNGTGSATINSVTGVATGVTLGTVTVRATEPVSGVISNGITLTVQSKTLQTLTVGGSATAVEGVATPYSVTAATYDNGDTAPLPTVTWSLTPGTGTGSVNATTGVLTGGLPGTVTLTGTNVATGVNDSTVVTVLAKTVTSLTISGNSSVVEGLDTSAYTVTGVIYDNGDTSPLPTVTWSVIAGTGTATINSSTGVATGGSPGTVTVRGTEPGSGVFDDLALTVVAKTVTGMTISGAATVVEGLSTAAYTVTAVTYNNGDTAPIPTVNWSVANGTGTATINSSTGVATGGALGTVTVRAQEPSSGVFSNGITLTVLAKTLTGMTVSGDPTVVEGLTTAAYSITAATYDNGDTTPLPTGITWSVSAGTGTATINSSTGVATGVTPGSVTVTGTHPASGVNDAFALNVLNKTVATLTISGDASVYEGLSTAAYTLTGVTYDNGDTSPTPTVTWGVTNGTGTATVNSSTGVVTGVTAGTVTVTATHVASGIVSNGITLTVNASLVTSFIIGGDTAVLEGNSTAAYTVSSVIYNHGGTSPIPTVTWSVTPGTGSATINASTGVVTAITAGTVSIQATEPVSAVLSSNTITLTIGVRTVTSFTIGGDTTVVEGSATGAYTVTGVVYSDASTTPIPTVTWNVTNGTGAATINSSTGVVTAVNAGDVTVSATHVASGVTATTPITLTITPKYLVSIAIDQGSISTPLGLAPALTATGTYNDASTADVTYLVDWDSVTTAVATIGINNGQVTTKSVGTSSITATSPTGGVGGSSVSSPSITLTVTPAELASIVITPNPVINALPLGVNQQFTATGTNTDGSSAGDITATVTWVSSVPGVASIDAAGLASPLSSGTTVITATDATTGVVSPGVNLTVVPEVMASIAVTPDPPADLPVGSTQQMTATGTLSDASSAGDITTSVTWASTNTGVATVSATGLVTAVGTGTASITATSVGSGAGGVDVVSPGVTVTVIAPALVSLQVSVAGSATTVPQGGSVQLTAIGTKSDGSTSDETLNVTWVFSGSDISIDASGLLTGLLVNPTPTAIAATFGAIDSDTTGGSITMQVVAGTLQSISVLPNGSSIFVGQTLQFQAIGTYLGGATADLTPSVTWATDLPGVGTVSASGLGTAVAAGTATISATDPGTGVSSTQPGGTSAAMTVTASASTDGSTGSPLAITSPYVGQVAASGTKSYYVFTGLIPGKYYSVTQTTLNNEIFFGLYTSGFGTQLCFARNYESNTALENCTAAADGSGNLYVQVDSLAPGATFELVLSGPLTSPYWIETFQISYSGPGGTADTIIQIYSASDTTNAIFYGDDIGGGNLFSQAIADFTPGETYYIKVTHYGTDDGGYAVKVSNSVFPGGSSAPDPAQSVNDPNETVGTATVLTLNTQSDNALTNPGDPVDWFVITIP